MERSTSAQEILASPEMLGLLEQVQRSAPALAGALQRLDQFQQSGALDTTLDLMEVLHAARVSASDGMIARLASALRMLMELADTLMISGLPDRAPALLKATREARDAAAADKSFVGPFDALMAPREEELQFVIRFVLALARRLPKAMQE